MAGGGDPNDVEDGAAPQTMSDIAATESPTIDPSVPLPGGPGANAIVGDDTEETVFGHEDTHAEDLPFDDEGTVPELEWAETSIPRPQVQVPENEDILAVETHIDQGASELNLVATLGGVSPESQVDESEATLLRDVPVQHLAPPASAARSSADPTDDIDPAPGGGVEASRLIASGAVELGPYLLLGRVGEGGMADVRLAYERRDSGLRACVVKRIAAPFSHDANYRQLLEEEARVTGRLRHPNIVGQLGSGAVDGSPFIAFELVDGLNLRHLETLAGPDRIPLSVVLEIGAAVATALEYARTVESETGQPLALVHRDISPHNVLIDRRGTVKLADFGIARFMGRRFDSGLRPARGKLRYMAPEQMRGLPVDGRTDLFGLGVMLTELITQQPLLPEGPLSMEDVPAVVRERCEARGDLLEELIALLASMTGAQDDRPANAGVVAGALVAIRQDVLPLVAIATYVGEQIFDDLPPLADRALEDVVLRGGTEDEVGDPASRAAVLGSAQPPTDSDGPEPTSHPTTVSVLLSQVGMEGAIVPETHVAATFVKDRRFSVLVRNETYLRDVNSYLQGELAESMEDVTARETGRSASSRVREEVAQVPLPSRPPPPPQSQGPTQRTLVTMLAVVTAVALILFGIWLARG